MAADLLPEGRTLRRDGTKARAVSRVLRAAEWLREPAALRSCRRFSCDIACAVSLPRPPQLSELGQVPSDGLASPRRAFSTNQNRGNSSTNRLELVGNVAGRNDESVGLCAGHLPMSTGERGDALRTIPLAALAPKTGCLVAAAPPTRRGAPFSTSRPGLVIRDALGSGREPNGIWNASVPLPTSDIQRYSDSPAASRAWRSSTSTSHRQGLFSRKVHK